jgi:Flp pilus assembly pilin Flp
MRKFFQNFRKSESGATLVEYGVALLVAIVVGGIALTNLATATSTAMNTASTVPPDATDLVN